jgi:3-phenylpropionate/trans-cinnamate dioxygenase ferredoxin reductase subunit
MKPVVIVGASHAAAEAIASLRKQGWQAGIILIGDEPQLPYQRPPLSKAYYQDELAPEKLLIRPNTFYQKNEVTLRLGERVTRLDPQASCIYLDNNEAIDYSHLILATGTRARQLPIEGSNLESVHYLRTKSDVEKIKSQLNKEARLLIVGAGYIGLEVASSAIKLGNKVVVFEAMDRVLERVTSPVVSKFYQDVHRTAGVDIRLSQTIQRFEQTSGELIAHTSNNEALVFDAAIIGIGVVPNQEIADDAGLSCDNGILVNDYCQTDNPKIYAIGDCSNHISHFYQRRLRLESVPNALEQAKVAAASICGTPVVYDQLPWFWSDQYDIKLQTVGLFQGYDDLVVRGSIEQRKFSVFYLQNDTLIAVDAINSPADFMQSKKLILAKKPIDRDTLANPEVPLKSLLEAVS